jgi:PAS domain S-box-containing protein
VDPNRQYSSRIIGGIAFEKRLEEKRDLIEVARPYIDELYEFVRGTNFFVTLTDEGGCILYMIGDEENLNLAHGLKMAPGTFMCEEHIGTNAMGTALATGRAIQVTGKDHFIKAYHHWTCSGAIVRDQEDRIIGSIDMTGDEKSVHSHTLGMVVSAANAIHERLKLIHKNNTLSETNKLMKTLMDSMEDGFLSSDLAGRIMTVNKRVLQMFGYTEEEMLEMNVSQLMDQFYDVRNNCLRGETVLVEEYQVNARSGRPFYTVSAYPVRSSDGITACIFIFKDVKYVRKMANRIVGRRAIYTFDKIIGESESLLNVIRFAKKVASSKSTILLTGESGTGKEIFAHAIQNYSPRKEENFVIVNCASIPRNLIESELFGYVEGAFTGAKRGGQPGRFEIADGGTIFLDEVGEMRLDMQARLLRVIQEGVVTRVGSNESINVDVRIIAATNKKLSEEVKRGNFRLDLFYRLNVLPVRLPSLRDRPEDIPLLFDYFTRKIGRKINKEPIMVTQRELDILKAYNWPGNVRELENFVELMLNTERVPINLIKKTDPSVSGGDIMKPQTVSLEELEKQYIAETLDECDFNISHAAKNLGIGRNTLYRKIEKYAIECSKTEH